MENEVVDREEVQEAKTQSTAKKSKRSKSSFTVAQVLNGEFLTKQFVIDNLGFIFFIIVLFIVVVAKGYYGGQLLKDVDRAQKDLDEVNAEFIEVKAALEEETKRQVLVDKLSNLGLKETTNPTKVIRIKKKEEK